MALSPFLMMALSTMADMSTLVVMVSPPPPPEPIGRSSVVISPPFLLRSETWTDVPSSLTSTSLDARVLPSISLNLEAMALFCTALVLSWSSVSSTSTVGMVMSMLPDASGVLRSPLTVTCLTVPAPPKSSHDAADSHDVMSVPTNCLVTHLPTAVSNVMQRPLERFFSGTAAMAASRV